MKVEFYMGKNQSWYWRVVARNGRTVADGAEGYTRKIDAVRAFNTARTGIHNIFPPFQ